MYTPPPTDESRRTRRALSAKERGEVLAVLKEGGSVTSAAARFGLDRATVRRIRDGERDKGIASGTAGAVVTVRLATAETQAFEARVAGLGLRSRSEGLRVAVRAASGLLEFSREENAGLDELTRALNKIGVNVNQLARAANSGRLPAGGRQLDVLSELRREVSQLRAFMLDLTAERRRRGTKLFEQYARTERIDG
ncbi:MAG: plasmid mobilization relaxosome protein MobC [Proteobacteria bacterium]|nr:plasmid mobilization relaxosome protein MobC [Pseudomonadota bacterium]